MVKIKNKVTLKPKELIKYLLDLEETEFTLYIETEDGYNNLLKPKLKVENYITYNEEEETFTIEVEEEITEETEIDNLVEFYFDRYGDLRFANHKNKTIRQRLDKYSFKPQAFYSLNEDATMTLIWKDGKLVD